MTLTISVTGGKGGTGKSFVATNLAYYLALSCPDRKIVLADLDVETPNDHLLLGIKKLSNKEDVDIFFPKIDYTKCTSCGACVKVCDTGALIMSPGKPPFAFPRLCSGCWACYYVCPFHAISSEGRRSLAESYVTEVNIGDASFTLVSGILREGEEHTAPAVVQVKRRALSLQPAVLIVDTGAGTGNSISIALNNSAIAIAVTEPTPMGSHDLDAILSITDGMNIPVWVVINRYDIGRPQMLNTIIKRHNVERVYRIPFSKEVVSSYVKGVPLLAYLEKGEAYQAVKQFAADVASFACKHKVGTNG